MYWGFPARCSLYSFFLGAKYTVLYLLVLVLVLVAMELYSGHSRVVDWNPNQTRSWRAHIHVPADVTGPFMTLGPRAGGAWPITRRQEYMYFCRVL